MAKKNLLLALMVIFCSVSLTSWAQGSLDVSKFTVLENDLTARVTKPVKDTDEGKLCALIRVITDLKNLEFRADALGIVKQEKHTGEIWLYVPYGARSLSFSHEGYFPLIYQYSEEIREGTVYELVLKSYKKMDTNSVATNTQLFVLTHNPDEASVFVDDMEVQTENGVFAAMMTKGEHTYKVEAEQYEPVTGSFTLADEPVRETVTLNALFGTMELFTQPTDGFDVFVNGENVGKSPYKSGRMEPGKYQIRFEKEKYHALDTVVNIVKGVDYSGTFRLTSEADSLFYNRLLGGKKVAFGVNVGYLMPNVSSSAGGGFTGSPINYSLTDDRENVDYSSASGFSIGVSADIKLYKNFYLLTGLNFTQVKYSNSFSQMIEGQIIRTLPAMSRAYYGDMTTNFKEDYTMTSIEVPLLASYRIVLTKTGSLHLNIGPYFSYGLSAKMKLSGSEETSGNVYSMLGNKVQFDKPVGTFIETSHYSADMDMYSKNLGFVKTVESGASMGFENKEDYDFEDSPFKRFNYGLRIGATYELRGFQLGIAYNLQLSNMANDKFWESSRVPVFNGNVGENNMSGYKHRVHSLEIKLGYMLRY